MTQNACKSFPKNRVPSFIPDYVSLQAANIDSKDSQKKVSEEIRNVTDKSSSVMNSDDVKKTSEIIDMLIEYQGEGEPESKLDEEVCSY